MNKYEQLIEFIINEQEDKARELFHQIVVEKSRDIYESLIDEEDFDEAVGGNQVTGLVDEVEADEQGMQEAEDDLGMDSDADMGGDDMGGMDDMGGDDMGGEEAPIEDRVMDLEAALDELKAEFDALMADEENEPEHNDGMEDPDFGGDDDSIEFGGEEESNEGFVREYVEKVGGATYDKFGQSGDNGANAKSVVAGKNDMGGSAANIAKGGTEQAADGKPTPTPSNEYTKKRGDLPGAGSFQNVPGAKTKGYTNKATSYEKQHGDEGQTTDGKLPVDKKSLSGGKVR